MPGEIFCSWQQTDQLFRFVDQQGKMLRANPVSLFLVDESDKWNFFVRFAADQTFGFVFQLSLLKLIYI